MYGFLPLRIRELDLYWSRKGWSKVSIIRATSPLSFIHWSSLCIAARHASDALFNCLIVALPTDPPTDAPPEIPRPIPAPPINNNQLIQLQPLVEQYRKAMDDIGCYVIDLQIEARNKLLSGLFNHRVPRRKPLDSKFKVLSTEPAEMDDLMSYFQNETPWGKE